MKQAAASINSRKEMQFLDYEFERESECAFVFFSLFELNTLAARDSMVHAHCTVANRNENSNTENVHLLAISQSVAVRTMQKRRACQSGERDFCECNSSREHDKRVDERVQQRDKKEPNHVLNRLCAACMSVWVAVSGLCNVQVKRKLSTASHTKCFEMKRTE